VTFCEVVSEPDSDDRAGRGNSVISWRRADAPARLRHWRVAAEIATMRSALGRESLSLRARHVMTKRRGALLAACVLGALNAAGATALAQGAAAGFPERTVRIIVPFPAGGATDIVARALAERLSSAWKQPVIIENVAGAAGAIGS